MKRKGDKKLVWWALYKNNKTKVKARIGVDLGSILLTISISQNKNITLVQPKGTRVRSILDSKKYKNIRGWFYLGIGFPFLL